jgi:DNA-binding transcriptional MerR regulator
MQSVDPSQYMESAQVAALVGLTPASVRRAVTLGALKPSIVTARTRLFSHSDVSAWLKSGRVRRRRK